MPNRRQHGLKPTTSRQSLNWYFRVHIKPEKLSKEQGLPKRSTHKKKQRHAIIVTITQRCSTKIPYQKTALSDQYKLTMMISHMARPCDDDV